MNTLEQNIFLDNRYVQMGRYILDTYNATDIHIFGNETVHAQGIVETYKVCTEQWKRMYDHLELDFKQPTPGEVHILEPNSTTPKLVVQVYTLEDYVKATYQE